MICGYSGKRRTRADLKKERLSRTSFENTTEGGGILFGQPLLFLMVFVCFVFFMGAFLLPSSPLGFWGVGCIGAAGLLVAAIKPSGQGTSLFCAESGLGVHPGIGFHRHFGGLYHLGAFFEFVRSTSGFVGSPRGKIEVLPSFFDMVFYPGTNGLKAGVGRIDGSVGVAVVAGLANQCGDFLWWIAQGEVVLVGIDRGVAAVDLKELEREEHEGDASEDFFGSLSHSSTFW